MPSCCSHFIPHTHPSFLSTGQSGAVLILGADLACILPQCGGCRQYMQALDPIIDPESALFHRLGQRDTLCQLTIAAKQWCVRLWSCRVSACNPLNGQTNTGSACYCDNLRMGVVSHQGSRLLFSIWEALGSN